MGKAFIFRTTKRQQLNIEYFKMYQSVLEHDIKKNREENFIFAGVWDTESQ